MAGCVIEPFAAVIKNANVGSVMSSCTDADEEPGAASEYLLTELLRNERDFEGVVVTDYWSIGFLELIHRVAGWAQEAAGSELYGKSRSGNCRSMFG